MSSLVQPEAKKASRASLVRTAYWLAPVAIGSAGVSALLLSGHEGPAMRLWNAAGPLIYALVLFWLAYRMIVREPRMLWTPSPWLLAACGTYFGVGPLLYSFGRPETIRYVDHFYPVAQQDLLRLQILNNLGILLLVLGAVAAHTFTLRRAPRGSFGRPLSFRAVATVFLAIGVPVRYLFDVPAELGLLPFVLPGSIKLLGTFSALAIVPLTVLALRHGGGWIWLAGLLAVAEMSTAAIQLSKMAILIPVLLLFLGFWYVRPSKSLLLKAVTGVAVIYGMTVPLVAAGRLGLTGATGRLGGVPLSERVALIGRAVQLPREDTRIQHGWSRLNYAHAQSYALTRFDDGYAGQSFRALAFVFVPRLFWPAKPIVSDVGIEFNEEVTGNPNSRSAPGLFAEAYWNAGWAGVVFACLIVGWILGIFGRFAVQRVTAEDFLMLPVVFLGIQAGFRPDGWAVMEYAGAPALALILLSGLLFARTIWVRLLAGGRYSASVLEANGTVARGATLESGWTSGE
jgi:hypothetical protein